MNILVLKKMNRDGCRVVSKKSASLNYIENKSLSSYCACTAVDHCKKLTVAYKMLNQFYG